MGFYDATRQVQVEYNSSLYTCRKLSFLWSSPDSFCVLMQSSNSMREISCMNITHLLIIWNVEKKCSRVMLAFHHQCVVRAVSDNAFCGAFFGSQIYLCVFFRDTNECTSFVQNFANFCKWTYTSIALYYQELVNFTDRFLSCC